MPSGLRSPDDRQRKNGKTVPPLRLNCFAFFLRNKQGGVVMHKRSLLFESRQDGASPAEERPPVSVHCGRSQCRALVKFEPVPEWLVLYFKSDVKK